MNILFMGTPDFSVPSLKALAAMPGHKVVGVVTTPDQPVGRSLKMTPPPVKVCALELGLPVFQPEKLNTAENLELFKSLGADLLAVVAYGKIIGDKLLAAYPRKIINVHPSLLPKYRGVAPYQWALINGEKNTGVSIMYIAKELDAGDIILQKEIAVKDSDNASALHDSLAVMGAEMLAETVCQIDRGEALGAPQNHSEATYYKKIEKSMGHIDWKMNAAKIKDLVRGLCPWPSTYCFHNGDLIKIHEADIAICATPSGQVPGTVIEASEKGGLIVACGSGFISIKKLQLASKSSQSFETFLRGYKISSGDMLN